MYFLDNFYWKVKVLLRGVWVKHVSSIMVVHKYIYVNFGFRQSCKDYVSPIKAVVLEVLYEVRKVKVLSLGRRFG